MESSMVSNLDLNLGSNLDLNLASNWDLNLVSNVDSNIDSNLTARTEDWRSEDTLTKQAGAGGGKKAKKDNGRKKADAAGKNGEDSGDWAPVKVCRVCGDRALSFNFGVVTCESCKAFFRRNGARVEDFACPFNDNCPTNIYSRKHCQKCRLRKCYAVGMRLDAISKRGHNSAHTGNKTSLPVIPSGNDNSRDKGTSVISLTLSSIADKTSKETTIEKALVECDSDTVNIRMRVSSSSSTGDHRDKDMARELVSAIKDAVPLSQVSLDGTAQLSALAIDWPNMNAEKDSNGKEFQVQYEEEEMDRPSQSQLSSKKRQRCEIVDIDCGDTQPLSVLSTGQNFVVNFTPFLADFKQYSTTILDAPLSFPSSMPVHLKYTKLEELLMANKEWTNPDDSYPPLSGTCADDVTISDFFNIITHNHTNGIKQYQILAGFKKLSRRDQLALLTGRVQCALLTRMSIKHNMKTDKTDIGYPGSPEVSSDIPKLAGEDFYAETWKLKTTYPEKYRGNDSILAILCAIAFFNPDRPVLINKAAVDEERRIYLQLLKEYLESTFGQQEALWAFKYLVTWVSTACSCASMFRHVVVYEVDSATFGISKLVFNDANGETVSRQQ